jgi:hypothetical protein
MVDSKVTVSVPTAIQPGDLMIAEIAVRGGTSTTITAPAGWTLVRRDNRTTNIAQATYRRLVPSSPQEPASYTWTFTSGNDAAGGIAAYTGVNTVTPIDANNGQGNANSKNLTAPSITVPAGHNSDRLVGLYSISGGGQVITVPAGTAQLWSFHAIGFGVAVAAGDVTLTSSGATGNKVATANTAGVSIGVLIALSPQ